MNKSGAPKGDSTNCRWLLGVTGVAACLLLMKLAISFGEANEPPKSNIESTSQIPAEAAASSVIEPAASASAAPEIERTLQRPVAPDVYSAWRRFPRGLGATAQQVLETRDSSNALALAMQVKACGSIDDMIDTEARLLHRKDRKERLERYLSIKQDCTTLPQGLDDQLRVAEKLFALASESGVIGAAAEAGLSSQYTGKLGQFLLRDAQAGDLESMAMIGRIGVLQLGLRQEEAQAYAHAVLRAQDNWEAGVANRARTASQLMLGLSGVEFKSVSTGHPRESQYNLKVVPTAAFAGSNEAIFDRRVEELNRAMINLEKEREEVGRFGIRRNGS